jgi:hypothetical protein
MSKGWGIKSVLTPDPESRFDKVTYVPNFGDLLNALNKADQTMKNISNLDVEDREFFDDIQDDVKVVKNLVRTYLRKNYPEDYKKYRMSLDEVKGKLKEILVNKIMETSVSGGTASFTPGVGAQYATKFAFNPNKKADGTSRNYYFKMGFKPVPKKIKGSGMEVRQLFEGQEIDNYKLPEDIKSTIRSAYLKNNIESVKQNDFMYYITVSTGGLAIDEAMLRKLTRNKSFMGVYPKDSSTVQLGFRKR